MKKTYDLTWITSRQVIRDLFFNLGPDATEIKLAGLVQYSERDDDELLITMLQGLRNYPNVTSLDLSGNALGNRTPERLHRLLRLGLQELPLKTIDLSGNLLSQTDLHQLHAYLPGVSIILDAPPPILYATGGGADASNGKTPETQQRHRRSFVA